MEKVRKDINSKKKIAVIIVIVLLLLLLITAFILKRPQMIKKNEANKINEVAQNTELQTEEFKVSNLEAVVEGNDLFINGEVENTTDSLITDKDIEVEIYDKDKNVILNLRKIRNRVIINNYIFFIFIYR